MTAIAVGENSSTSMKYLGILLQVFLVTSHGVQLSRTHPGWAHAEAGQNSV